MNDVSITEVMICWTSDKDYFAKKSTRGKVALVSWPDARRASDIYVSTTGACDVCVQEYSPLERAHFVLSTALGMILRDGMSPAVVHAALWPLIEYRNALPDDTPPPPGASRSQP